MTDDGACVKDVETTVVINAFNEEATIETSIRSGLSQLGHETTYELLIIDNGSKDKTSEICKNIIRQHRGTPEIRYVRINHDTLSVGRNTAIQYARGRFIAFFDADARADEMWLANILEVFRSDPDTFIVGGRIANFNPEEGYSEFIFRLHYCAAVNSYALKLTGANMAFRREVFQLRGGFFNVIRSLGDETAVTMDFLKHHPDKKLTYAPDSIVYHEHPTSVGSWLKYLFRSGRSACFIARNVAPGHELRTLIRSGFMSLNLVSYICLTCVAAGLLPVWLAGPAVAVWGARHFRRKKYFLESLRETRRSCGPRAAFAALFVATIGVAVYDFAFALEAVAGERLDANSMARSGGETTELLSSAVASI